MGLLPLSGNHVRMLSAFLPLAFTQEDLACLAYGEKRGNKRMSDQCRVAMASWVIWSKPSKMEGQAVARLCCETERALWLRSLKRTRLLFTHTDIPLKKHCDHHQLVLLPTITSYLSLWAFINHSTCWRESKELSKRLRESLNGGEWCVEKNNARGNLL